MQKFWQMCDPFDKVKIFNLPPNVIKSSLIHVWQSTKFIEVCLLLLEMLLRMRRMEMKNNLLADVMMWSINNVKWSNKQRPLSQSNKTPLLMMYFAFISQVGMDFSFLQYKWEERFKAENDNQTKTSAFPQNQRAKAFCNSHHHCVCIIVSHSRRNALYKRQTPFFVTK